MATDEMVEGTDLADIPRLVELVRYLAEHDDELRSLVALIRVGDDPRMIAGSGTLVRVGGASFLITASHVVKHCNERGGFRIPCPSRKRLLSIGAEGILGGDDDKHDVAVLRIADDVAVQLESDGHYFLSTAHIETVPPPDLSTGRCLVLGYPQERVKEGVGIAYVPQAFVCELASPENADSLSSQYDPTHHFLLRQRALATDIVSGERERSVLPHGMSGGSLWWLGAEDDVGSVAQRAERIRWIGVQSAVFPASRTGPGFLKAVTLQSAATLMVRQWPELGPVLALHRFPAVPRSRLKPTAL